MSYNILAPKVFVGFQKAPGIQALAGNWCVDKGRGKSTNVCWSIVFCPTVFNEVTMLVNRHLHVTF